MGWNHRFFSSVLVHFSFLTVIEHARLTYLNEAMPGVVENVSFGRLSELRKGDGRKPFVRSTLVILKSLNQLCWKEFKYVLLSPFRSSLLTCNRPGSTSSFTLQQLSYSI